MVPPRLVFIAVVALPLTACSHPSDDVVTHSVAATSAASSSPSASPSASPSPSPSPSATAAAAGDPCTDPSVSVVGLAAIDFDRYQGICLGMSFAQASAAMSGQDVTGETACPWYATVVAVADPGLYVGAMTRPDDPGADIYLFRMTWQGDQATAAGFDAPATAANISVGSTTAEVMAAYPSATAVVVDDIARGTRNHLLVQGPSSTTFDFDVTDGYVTDIYWGKGIPQGVNGELCAL